MIFFHLAELQRTKLNAQGISDLNTCENWGSADQALTFTVPTFSVLQLPLLLSQFELVLHSQIPVKSDKSPGRAGAHGCSGGFRHCYSSKT